MNGSVNGRRLLSDEGYGFVELLVILAITGLLAVLAVPSYGSMVARSQLRSAATDIASQLRMARQLAMARRERLSVHVDTEQRVLSLERTDTAETLDVYRYGDRGIVVAEPTGGPDIVFHPSGRSAAATTIELSHVKGLKAKLTVTLTGRVVIS
jgi:type IV fimbrial biogenesis protein FimT